MSKQEPMSEYRQEWVMTILKLMQGRRGHLEETLRLTKEVGESLDRNDQVSVQMLLKMRGEELEAIGENMRAVRAFITQLRQETQEEAIALLQEKPAKEQDRMSDKIVETVKRCQRLLEEIRIIDERMSKRIAGEDSFYGK